MCIFFPDSRYKGEHGGLFFFNGWGIMNRMKSETLKTRPVLAWGLMTAALLTAINALALKYIGHVFIPLVLALLLSVVVLIYGFGLMSCFKSLREEIGLTDAFGVGFVFTAFYFYLACFFNILGPAVLFIFYSGSLPLAVWLLRRRRVALRETVTDFFKRSLWGYAVFSPAFIFALFPSTFYDTLVYHLGIPNLYLQHGGFIETPQFLFANTSIYYEIGLIPAVHAGDLVPRLFHFILGAVFLLGAADFAVERLYIKNRNIFLLTAATMPVSMFLVSTVKNDLAGAFFVFLGVRWLLKERYGVSAFFWGFAIGIKYFNALTLVLFLLVFLVKEKRFPFKKLVIFCLITVAVVLPLLVKNYYYAGNPFFPFFGEKFEMEQWDASRYALMQNDVGKMYHTLPEFLKLPYTLSFDTLGFGGTVGAQFIILLPLLVLGGTAVLKKKWYLLVFSLLLLYVGGYFTVSVRFLYIGFIFLCIYLTVVYESGGSGKILIRSLFYCLVAFNIVLGLAQQEQMFRSVKLLRGVGDVEAYKAAMFPSYPAIDFVNRNTEPDSQVILVGEARNFYLKRPYRLASGIDYSILKTYLTKTDNSEVFVSALANDNIDYMILNLAEFNRLQKGYHRLDRVEWKKMAVYLKDMQSRIVFQKGGLFVFKI